MHTVCIRLTGFKQKFTNHGSSAANINILKCVRICNLEQVGGRAKDGHTFTAGCARGNLVYRRRQKLSVASEVSPPSSTNFLAISAGDLAFLPAVTYQKFCHTHKQPHLLGLDAQTIGFDESRVPSLHEFHHLNSTSTIHVSNWTVPHLVRHISPT